MTNPTTKTIVAAHREHERLKAEVMAWMKAQGGKGQLRQNRHAPMWGQYETAVAQLNALGDCITPLCDRIEALELALKVAHKYCGCADEPGSSSDVCFICKALQP